MHTSCIRRPFVAGLALALGLVLLAPGPASAETPPAPDQVFVERLYAKALGRPASSGETGYWLQQLGAGTPRTTVAVRVAGAPEGRRRLVALVYPRAFDREASAAERDYWAGRLLAGRTPEAMLADITLAPEVDTLIGDAFADDDASGYGPSAYLFLLYLGRLVHTEDVDPRPEWRYWADRAAADLSKVGLHRLAITFGRLPDPTQRGIRSAVALACGDQTLTPAQRWTLGATWTAARFDSVRLAAMAVAVVCPTADA